MISHGKSKGDHPGGTGVYSRITITMLHSDITMRKEEASTGELIGYYRRIYLIAAQTCKASMVACGVGLETISPLGKQRSETSKAFQPRDFISSEN